MNLLSQIILNAPRWLLLGALVFAPWAYGATRPWAIQTLDWWLLSASGLWLLGLVLRQQRPSLPLPLGLTLGALVFQAWFMVFNAKYDYDVLNLEFVALNPLLPWAPGSLHRELSRENAIHLTAILAAVAMACELAQSSIWRKRVCWTFAATGASVVVLGLAQKLTGATNIFWEAGDLGPNFFATFRNHTNAGAFINLIWPIAGALALLVVVRKNEVWKRALWLALLAIGLAGMASNSSRAAGTIAALLAVLSIGWLAWQRWCGRFEALDPVKLTFAIGGLAALIASLAIIAGMNHTVTRWRQFDKQLTAENTRLLAAQVCLKMIPEAGIGGFGPGTFQTAFPYFTQSSGKHLKGRWIFAHQDYLQTLVEWGYVGGALWAVLFFGGIGYSLRRSFRHDKALSDSACLTHVALLIALVGVLLHALVDFPLQIASIQLYVAVMLGLLWGSRGWLRPGERWLSSRTRSVKPAREMILAP